MSSDDEDVPTPTSEDSEASSKSKVPQSEAHFAFGPQNWYWVRCGTRWRFVRSSSSDWSRLNIQHAWWVAFKHDTGFFIGGEDDDGEARVVHVWNDGHMVRADNVDSFVKTRDAYIRLQDWLSERVNMKGEEVKKVSLSIGPKGGYYARHRTAQLTHALPKDLQKAIDESGVRPESVALGIKGSWIVVWADGTVSWDLRNAYPGLADRGHLKNTQNPVVFAALNPYAEDYFFTVQQDGQISYNAKFNDREEGPTLHEMTDTYMRARAKRDGSSFSFSATINGVPREVRISPSSNAQESRTEDLIARLRARQAVLNHGDKAFIGAIVGGTSVMAKVVGLPTAKAVGVGALTGLGSALALWYRG